MRVTLSDCAALSSVLLDVCIGARYCVKLLRKQAHPRLATWLIFEIGIAMSLVTYFASQSPSAFKASLNLADAVIVAAIIVSLLIKQQGNRLIFTSNEKLSLVISGFALAAWCITQAAWVGFVGFQVVMCVAYVPTIESVGRWRPGPAPEPVEMWAASAMAALLGIVADITGIRRDYLAMLYPLRAFLFCIVIVVLVQRWKHKNSLRCAPL